MPTILSRLIRLRFVYDKKHQNKIMKNGIWTEAIWSIKGSNLSLQCNNQSLNERNETPLFQFLFQFQWFVNTVSFHVIGFDSKPSTMSFDVCLSPSWTSRKFWARDKLELLVVSLDELEPETINLKLWALKFRAQAFFVWQLRLWAFRGQARNWARAFELELMFIPLFLRNELHCHQLLQRRRWKKKKMTMEKKKRRHFHDPELLRHKLWNPLLSERVSLTSKSLRPDLSMKKRDPPNLAPKFKNMISEEFWGRVKQCRPF